MEVQATLECYSSVALAVFLAAAFLAGRGGKPQVLVFATEQQRAAISLIIRIP